MVKFGGRAVNGMYSLTGEADLQCGYPYEGVLLDLVVEVKTEIDYYRVMKCIDIIDKRYVLNGTKGLKEHEALQIHKINVARNLGGLGLIAFNFEQVKEFCKYIKLKASDPLASFSLEMS